MTDWSSRLRDAILELARKRAPTGSLCPSDAARVVGGDDWRKLMAETRSVAVELAKSGQVEITQRGERLDPEVPLRGPIRIRLPPH